MVFIRELRSYDFENIKDIFYEYLQSLPFTLKNQKILLKPNLISPKNRESCVNSDPILVAAIGDCLKDFGNKIFIGDSPGVGTLNLNLKVAGYSELIKKYGIEIYNFRNSVTVERVENKVLKKFDISNAVFEFDSIVNIAKLKTHCMTGMTLSVKNLYGFITGKDKILYHLKAGANVEYFADILLDISETVKPILNVVDGIYGMEGDGPTSGTPRLFGFIGFSHNPYTLDRVVEKAVSFPNKSVIVKQAYKRGLINDDDFKDIPIPSNIGRIKLAKTKSANFNIPKFISDIFSAKPIIDSQKCKKCFKCLESCPPHAIYLKSGELLIDYHKCIKCYCCKELCLYNAVALKKFF